jgi:hypothetical protein
MAMTEHAGEKFGGNGNYTYILKGIPSSVPYSNPQFPTRHRAVGEKVILEVIHLCEIEIVARERHATDPANKVNAMTPCEIQQANREAAE